MPWEKFIRETFLWERLVSLGARRRGRIAFLVFLPGFVLVSLPQDAAGRGGHRLSHARARGPAAGTGVSRRTKMLAEKIKQLADQVLDKNATVQSVAAHVGPWQDDGSPECPVTPRDRDFQSGRIGIGSDHGHPHTPAAARRPDYLDLTLAKDAVLTVDALGRVFGKQRAVTPPPHGNPYSVVFYYPNDKAMLSVAVFAELSGPAGDAATRITSLTLRRDDVAEAFRQ